ncbi:unnamed protein product [Lactuca saligna]|uniref:Uncharacterized protein n=1 Tax=Lactuca saligna TaxID=75948 RepID=A0AA35ZS63_LACSI|nr:unnamed protein product [Lactuca saligna]
MKAEDFWSGGSVMADPLRGGNDHRSSVLLESVANNKPRNTEMDILSQTSNTSSFPMDHSRKKKTRSRHDAPKKVAATIAKWRKAERKRQQGCLGFFVCRKRVGEYKGGCCPWLAGNHQQTPLVGVFLLHLEDMRKRSECERKWKNENLYLSMNSSAFMCE